MQTGEFPAEEQDVQTWAGSSPVPAEEGGERARRPAGQAWKRAARQADRRAGRKRAAPAGTPRAASLCPGQLTRVSQMRFALRELRSTHRWQAH